MGMGEPGGYSRGVAARARPAELTGDGVSAMSRWVPPPRSLARCRWTPHLVPGAVLSALLLLGVLACEPVATPAAWREAAPHPGLGPADVVAAQLEALQHNDERDAGIAVAFRFASPGNRRSTGPLERFVWMIRDGPYELLLGFDGAHAQPVVMDGTAAARQRVTVVRDGRSRVYHFVLSQQRDGECRGCWMTDAVLVEDEPAAESI